MNTGTCNIERKLADRDTLTVPAKISETQDTRTIGNDSDTRRTSGTGQLSTMLAMCPLSSSEIDRPSGLR